MRLYRSLTMRETTSLGRAARRRELVLGMLLVAALALGGVGCGGGAMGDPGPRRVPEPVADAGANPGGIPDPITTDRGDVYNVTLYSGGTQLYVDKLEIEFNRRRGIHSFYGFYRDAYDELTTIAFKDLVRVDFIGPMPHSLFDQAILGREDQNLRKEHAFELRLTFRDQSQEEFYAIIPKLRGEKDFQLWEYSMNNANRAIEYIEFNR